MSLTSHHAHHGPHQGGFQSDLEGLMAMVERGCAKLMKAGGGPLTQEIPRRGYRNRITAKDWARIDHEFKKGVSLMTIAREQHVSYNSVCRHTREARKQETLP